MLNSKFNRRQFFLGASKTAVGAAVLVSAATLPFLSSNPRLEAICLLDEATVAHTIGGRAASHLKSKELLEYLNDNFEVVDNEQTVAELRTYFRDDRHFDPANCSDTAFAVLLMREGLKDRRLPLVQSPAWADFARKYVRVIMAA